MLVMLLLLMVKLRLLLLMLLLGIWMHGRLMNVGRRIVAAESWRKRYGVGVRAELHGLCIHPTAGRGRGGDRLGRHSSTGSSGSVLEMILLHGRAAHGGHVVVEPVLLRLSMLLNALQAVAERRSLVVPLVIGDALVVVGLRNVHVLALVGTELLAVLEVGSRRLLSSSGRWCLGGG